MKRLPWLSLLSLGALLALGGCADSGNDSSSSLPSGATPGAQGPGAFGVSQGGAQDFGLFRQILDKGGIPGPETLDDRGFFAEHKLDYPSPECGQNVCMHGLVGMRGNMITGGKCTLLQIGLNSPLDPTAQPRPPMHLVLSVDVSGSMLGEPMNYLREGLVRMIDSLDPQDTVSLVTFSDQAKVVLEAHAASDKEGLTKAFESIKAIGATNLYDGLATALSLTDQHLEPGRQPRVIFLSDGEATVGLTSDVKIRSLASAYARQGVPITSIGVGQQFDVGLMQALGEAGAGNFYFLEDPAAVAEVFSEEVATFLMPVALDVTIEAAAGAAYDLRTVYGTRTWQSGGPRATIEIPSLFLAGRFKASDPIEGGRRGGGGAMLVELVPRSSSSAEAQKAVGALTMRWKRPDTGEEQTQSIDLSSPYSTSDVPSEGYFTSFTSEKGFVMLNLFAGFQIAAKSARDGDTRTAEATLAPLEKSVESWLVSHDDADIADDLKYVRRFRQNLAALPGQSQLPAELPPAQNPWPIGD